MNWAWGRRAIAQKGTVSPDVSTVFEADGARIAVLCDGRDPAAGAHAAQAALESLTDTLSKTADPVADLEMALQRANKAIYETARRAGTGATTSAVVVIERDGNLHVAHVGNARAWRVRGGEVELLTRDHTMVNHFVDNGLLSPDDAADHPEAGVLARSLGAERQVDVDSRGPLALQEDDTLLLTTDGLHDSAEPHELAAVDWRDPATASGVLFERLEPRIEADAATVVALTFGPRALQRGEAAEAPRVSEAAGITAFTQVPEDSATDLGELQAPELLPDGPAPRAPTPMGAPPRGTPTPDFRKRQAPHTPEEFLEQEKVAGKASRAARLIAAASAAVGLTLLAGGIALWMAGPSPAPTPPTDPATGGLLGSLPEVGAPTEEAAAPPGEAAWFTPDLLPLPERTSKLAKLFVSPSPGSQLEREIVRSAKVMHDCGPALAQMGPAMQASPDHAPLYRDVWWCFTIQHQQRVTEVRTRSDLNRLIGHLEGELAPPEGGGPAWMSNSVGGLEQRLDAWAVASSGAGLFDEVIDDAMGRDAATAHLANDLLLELGAAQALQDHVRVAASSVDDSALADDTGEVYDDALTEALARRLYVLARHWHGAVGERIRLRAPEAGERLSDGLTALTGPVEAAWSTATGERRTDFAALGAEADLPDLAAEAWLVGKGVVQPPAERPRPTPTRVIRRAPPRPPTAGILDE